MAHCFCHTHLIVLSNDLPRFYKEVIRFLSKHNNIQCSSVILRLHTAILEYWMNSCFHSVFQVSADLAFHQSWDVRPILPNFPWNMVSVSLADYQFLSLWHQPFFQSLSAFVHLPCYQPGSFNPGVQPRPCTVGADWFSLFWHEVLGIPTTHQALLVHEAGCVWQEDIQIFCEVFTVRIISLFLGPFQLLHLSYPHSDKKY